ncbi:hypothetical protein Aduo_000897 [Ancylostoma duodenale]
MSTSEDHKKGFLFLTTLRDDDVIDDVEKDMIKTMNEIRQQIKVSHALEAERTLNDWRREEPETHDSSLPGGREHMLVVNRFLRTATVTREKLLRLTQRYLRFDTIFAILVKYDEVSSTTRTNFVETMNFREERVKIEKELEKLDKNIIRMSRELGIAERRVKDEKGAIAQFQKEKRLLMQEFNNKIRGMEDKLENFMFSSIDQKPEPVEQETVVMEQKKQKYSAAKDEPKSQVETLPDEGYMARLVDEVRDDEDDININEESINSDDYNDEPIVVLPAKREPEDPFDSDDDPDYFKKRRLYEPDPISRVKELEQDLDDLHHGLKFLPQRKI